METDLAERASLPPCTAACPLDQKVMDYVRLLSLGRVKEALLTVREDNPLPGLCAYVCHHPCESACLRGTWDEPVAVRELKRHAFLYEKDNREEILEVLKSRKRPLTGRKAVIVGAGPAGLACSYELAMGGMEVQVMDALDRPGGMLIHGIPSFRLPRWVIEHEVEMVRSLGVEFMTSFRLGKDVTFRELREEENGAIVVTTGAWKDLELGIEGEGDEGCIPCLEFLGKANRGELGSVSGRVLVIGGGNAAVDTARCASRLGAREVVILYRRGPEEMPALREEMKAALDEGVRIEYRVAPVRMIREGDRVTGVELVRTRPGSPDDSGRRSPVPLPGSAFKEPADLIVTAIGQRPDPSFLEGDSVSPEGRVRCSADGMVEGMEGVFAAGDAVTGPSTVVEAIASGKRVARRVLEYLGEAEAC